MLKLAHTYQETDSIKNLLITIEANNKAIALVPVADTRHLDNLRRTSLLNSAVYSARIEGNRLTTDTFHSSAENLKKIEVQNLLDTYSWLTSQSTDLNIAFIKDLHFRSMHNLVSYAGHFRTEQSAIFDSSGTAIYLTPPPQDIPELLATWLSNLNDQSLPTLVKTAVSHFEFEKIHPFLDGNGRVGRLISSYYLSAHGYGMLGLLSFEKYLEQNRASYYHTLALESSDITPFVEFFLQAIAQSGQKALDELTAKSPSTNLLPRRQEILEIIKDHHIVSFDFLHRRFMAIPGSTLRYDLLSLAKAGYIKKLGATRGAMYQIA